MLCQDDIRLEKKIFSKRGIFLLNFISHKVDGLVHFYVFSILLKWEKSFLKFGFIL